MDFRRFAWNNALPKSLNPLDAILKNSHGTEAIPWKFKGITHANGWTTTVILGNDYELSFRNLTQLTNITYRAKFYEFNTTDKIRMMHVFKQEPDFFTTIGAIKNASEIPPPLTGNHGDWGFVNETKTLTYLVTGNNNPKTKNNDPEPRSIHLKVYIDMRK